MPAQDRSPTLSVLRDQLSSVRSLLVLSMLMTHYGDETQIIELATSAVPSLGPLQAEAVYVDGTWHTVASSSQTRVDGSLRDHVMGGAGGSIDLVDHGWAQAWPLDSPGGVSGYLVVSGPAEPPEQTRFLLQVLAQQTGVALANAHLLARERRQAEELRAANLALTRSMAIHERFTRVALADGGQSGIAQAVHDLTGYPVAVEDRYGNLVAWAGPARPDPYPRTDPQRREAILERAIHAASPVRHGDRLLVVVRPRPDIEGVLALVDPAETAGLPEQTALEHGSTVLAMELIRLHGLGETELRLQRDLVEAVLAGSDPSRALYRAQALRYDLGRPHRVVVVEGQSAAGDEALLAAVRRAARECGIGPLVVARLGTVVVLADTDCGWEDLRKSISARIGPGRCRVGVGGRCARLEDFPRSYREAQLAVKVQRATCDRDQAIAFDDLGVYQFLGQAEDMAAVERLVRRWLGPLLDHDAERGSQLVSTLDGYLESGGNYAATATLLSVHRSTLKYRLQRIREVSGYDLTDPDSRFNLQLACRAHRTLAVLREP